MSPEPTTAARERPIIFSGPMVRAILEGRKSATRRPLKPQPERHGDRMKWCPPGARYVPEIDEWAPACIWDANRPVMETGAAGIVRYCPFGVPGDHLWVRETWRCNHIAGHRIEYRAGGACLEYENWPPDTIPPYADPLGPTQVRRTERQLAGEKVPDAWRSPIHMPRWAVRVMLEITGVKVERLKSISTADAFAEGIEVGEGECSFADECSRDTWPGVGAIRDDLANAMGGKGWHECHCVVDRFARRWDELNAKRGSPWETDPYVWAIEFRRVNEETSHA